MIHLLPLQHTDEALARYAQLMRQVFPASAQLDTPYLDWLYRRNPDGLAMGHDAWDGDTLVAHYACVPCRLRLDGQVLAALLSLNTATHPAYQGQGLFTRLARQTYADAAAQGYAAVYGVANANSTPGFVGKLGFALVEPVQALLGLATERVDLQALEQHTRLARVWSEASWAWRLACPRNPVLARPAHDGMSCLAPALGRWLWVQARLPQAPAGVTVPSPSQGGCRSPLRLHLGLWPGQGVRHPLALTLPDRLRPSPLNLIYKPLLPQAPSQVSAGTAFITFLDFDAF